MNIFKTLAFITAFSIFSFACSNSSDEALPQQTLEINGVRIPATYYTVKGDLLEFSQFTIVGRDTTKLCGQVRRGLGDSFNGTYALQSSRANSFSRTISANGVSQQATVGTITVSNYLMGQPITIVLSGTGKDNTGQEVSFGTIGLNDTPFVEASMVGDM